MHDIEGGPVRRLPRAKRRSVGQARQLPEDKLQPADVCTRSLHEQQGNQKDGWFSNSFQSRARHLKTHQSTSSNTTEDPQQTSSPKAKRRRKSSCISSLDTSDALLADLDIETIVETASQTKGLTQPQDNQSQDSQDTSQYFSSKFGQYKATQVSGKQVQKHKEVSLNNTLFTQKGNLTKKPTSVNQKNYQVDIEFSTTQVLSDKSHIQVLDSEEWDAKEPITSTQINKPGFGQAHIKSGSRSTHHVHDARVSTPYLGEEESNFQEERGNDRIVEITLLKDGSPGKAITCTPIPSRNDRECELNSQSALSEADTTLLKDDGGKKSRFRCTPYTKQSQSTQIQSQTELVAGTQYASRMSEYIKNQSQMSQQGTGMVGSQYPSQMCDMTGVIVDSQDNEDKKCHNTSGCDIFNDSFHGLEPATQEGSRPSNGCHDNNYEVTCHTQAIVAEASRTIIKQAVDCTSNADANKQNQTRRDVNINYTVRNMVEVNPEVICSTALTSETTNLSGSKALVGNVSTSTSVLGTKISVTPGRSGSLQDRIKQRLKENVGQKTPKGASSLVERLREQVLERVQLEADMQVSNSDIGPFYGLPSKVQHLFENYRGIKKFYDWQDECLKLPAVTERRNLIYSLPTSGGKTLVAEILILKALLCLKQDALLILPFVSIVQEKVRNIGEFAVDLNFHVEEYAGSKGRFPPLKRRKNRSLYIATIEKAHSIINSLTELDRMDSLGLVVVDELHMLGEGGSRGATLEATLMKILQASGPTQIIGMSATLNNIADLQKFLNAEIYTNNFRPVSLTEYVKLGESIYSVDQKAKAVEDQFTHDRVVCFQYPAEMEKLDPDHLLGLALEVIPDNSCLVFCHTKKNCENVAAMLSKLMMKYKRELHEVKKQERHSLLKELYNDSEGKVCPTLRATVPWGVAYHHSGLTMDERKLIEDGYANGTLCLLACTSTLAAGVNLPAKRVILRSPYVGQCFISRSQYKQMVGRAGRAGIDTSGESILICKPADREKVCELLASPIEKCHSSLVYDGGRGIRSLLLSSIGLKITPTTEDVFKFITRSLCHIQQKSLHVDVNQLCRDALQSLIDSKLVVQTKAQTEDPVKGEPRHSLEVTELGQATFKGPIDPDYACRLYKDLKQAEDPLVISTHLHLLYLVTPYDAVTDMQPSWFIYFNQMSALSPSELKVASLIGVPESYIARRASQQKSKLKVDEFVVKRFYLTLMLYDLWRQRSVWEVADRYQQPRGFIQNLLSNAASFASCVAHFCQELKEFWAYQDLLGKFVKQLAYCVTAELIPLMEIPGVKLGRARLMFDAGYKTLSAVSGAKPEDLVKVVQFMPRKVAQQIVASAKLLLSEKTEAMMEEMEQLVTIPTNIVTTISMATELATPSLLQTPSLSQMSTDSTIPDESNNNNIDQ